MMLSSRALVLLLLFLVALALPGFHLIPLGIPDEFEYRYVAEPVWDPLALLFCLLPVAGILATVAIILRKEETPRRWEIFLSLVSLAVNSFLFHLACAVALSPFGMAEALYHLMQEYGDGSYMLAALKIQDFPEYLAGLENELEGADIARFPHPSVHPPGFTFIFFVLHRVVEWNLPGVQEFRAWIWDNSPMLREMFPVTEVDYARVHSYLAAACLAAVAFWAVAGLLPIPTYFLARLFLGPRGAFLAAAITTLLPGTHLFNPATDQILPLVSTLLLGTGMAAMIKRRLSLALVFGMLLGLAVQLSLALGVIAVLCAFFAVGYAILCRADRNPHAGSAGNRPVSVVALALRAGTGLAIVFAFFLLAYRLNLVRVIRLCMENNDKFNRMVQRSYSPWLLMQPLETAYSLGLPMFFILVAAVSAQLSRWRPRIAGPGEIYVWVTLLATLLLGLSGVNRGEVGRLWLFLYPALGVAACLGLVETQESDGREAVPDLRPSLSMERCSLSAVWLLFLAALAIQTILMRLHVDAMRSSSSLSGVI